MKLREDKYILYLRAGGIRLSITISSSISRDKLYKEEYVPDLTAILEESDSEEDKACYDPLIDLLICIIENSPLAIA